MYKLDRVAADELEPGVYRYTAGEHPANIAAFLSQYDWRSFYLDGRLIKDKASFLDRAAAAMDFPDYVGHNWDAFEEAIRDLEWAPAEGYVLIYDSPQYFSTNSPAEWKTTLSILQDAVDYWRGQSIPLFVLLRKTGGALGDIQRL